MVAINVQSTELSGEPIVAPSAEREALRRVARLLAENDDQPATIRAASGIEIALPLALHSVLRQIAQLLADDNGLVLQSLPAELTLRQAADVLSIPVPALVRLLDGGTLPTVGDGDFHLVPRGDVLAYRMHIKTRRREALRELSRLSQELGLSDLDDTAIKLKRLAELDDDATP